MIKSDAKHAGLMHEADQAKAEVDRLFNEAMAKPSDEAAHQHLWNAIQHLGKAVGAAVEYSRESGRKKNSAMTGAISSP